MRRHCAPGARRSVRLLHTGCSHSLPARHFMGNLKEGGVGVGEEEEYGLDRRPWSYNKLQEGRVENGNKG